MTYHLYCTVNAIGIPYNDTFHPSKERSWGIHRWRDVPKDGEHHNSCQGITLENHEKELRAKGDRVVPVVVETSENVSFSLLEEAILKSRCPKCASTDIQHDVKDSGSLVCMDCHHSFTSEDL